jgi:hypothetical protein
VLRDLHHQIALGCFRYGEFKHFHMDYSRQLGDYISLPPAGFRALSQPHGNPYDPVLHACELFKSCVLDDTDVHRNCRRARTGISAKVDTLPCRLLDLSHGGCILTLDVQTWINTGRATVDQLSDYCTLTYRWGKGPPDCMLRTEFTRERESSLESLPRTFKDAIIIARALGIRFIWIDAMCIIQPSAHGDFADWNVEGPRMWLIYQNAICNIAATCSNDPNDGFLSRVGTDNIAPCSILQQTEDGGTQPVFMKSTGDELRESVVLSKLNRRGWVAQERLLSQRILHFTEERVFWECQAHDQNDDVPGYKRENDWDYVQSPSLITYRQWLSFIEFYSNSSFTQPADRLVALSSIARSIPVERFGTTYFAGIWKESLVRGLSWRSKESCSSHLRKRYLDMAPSWSWASVPGGIEYPYRDFHGATKNLVQLQSTSISLAQVNNSYGNVERGALKLLARKCGMPLPTANQKLCYDTILNIENREYATHIVHWDELQDSGVAESIYRVVPLCIRRYRRLKERFSIEGSLECLIVALLPPTGDEDRDDSCDAYQRIGLLEIEWKIRKKGAEKKGDYTHGTSPLDLFDTILPGSNPETIIII